MNIYPLTPPGGMLRRPFRYNESLMYSAVLDINYVAESVVPGVDESLDGEIIGLKISGFTIEQ